MSQSTNTSRIQEVRISYLYGVGLLPSFGKAFLSKKRFVGLYVPYGEKVIGNYIPLLLYSSYLRLYIKLLLMKVFLKASAIWVIIKNKSNVVVGKWKQ